MSLHKFAEQVASQGRGDDSLLVHMTPDEVRNLQQFAQANGTTLTINPTTGLPEAGLLSDLFKAVAPIALGAFLGPGAFGIAGMGLSAGTAGLITGGITSLATGSLSRGLMAGLGAYGGAGLAQGALDAGNAQLASTMSEGAQAAAGAGDPTAGMNAVTREQALSAGAKAVSATPQAALNFAKGNLGNLAFAAAPIVAGAMVPTTTKLPDPKDTGYIRQMAYNINPDTGMPDPLYGRVEMAPVKASEFGNKTFQGQRDLFYKQNQNQNQNQNPYDIGIGSLNQPPQQQQPPTQMNTGGIVALAGGGDVPGYATGSLVGDADILNYFKTPGLSDAQIAADMQKYQVSAADIARATGTQNQQADYEKRFVNTLIAPTTDSSEFLKATGAVGLQGQSLTDAMQNAGLSQGAQYALTQPAMSDAGFTGGIIDAGTGKPVELYNQIGYKAGALPGDQAGLEGLYGNINYVTSGLQNLINTGKMSVADAQNAALAELQRTNVSVGDVKAATGKDFGNLFTAKEVVKPPVVLPPPTNIVPGGTRMPGATVYDDGSYGNYGSGPATGVDYRGNTVSIATPGDIITNPDGTRTVVPNIPGRPDGGFTGVEQVKSRYTAGGGSLGYTAPVPKTPAEHNATYNKMTDDSLDAYNFLMGKGKNLTQRKAETRDRPVMQRYDEAILGRKMGKPVATTATTKKVIGVPGQPHTYFNEAEYLAANPDVAAELKSGKSNFTSGYEHYLRYGKTEGRKFAGDYEGYTTAAALAEAAGAGGGGPGNTTAPGLDADSTSPANSPPGDTVAKEGGMMGYAMGGGLGSLGSYSDGGRLLRGPGDGVSDSIPATIGQKQQPARLADGEFVIPARIVSELGNGSTDAGAKKLYAMMDRVQRARGKTTGKNKVAANSRSDKYLPA